MSLVTRPTWLTKRDKVKPCELCGELIALVHNPHGKPWPRGLRDGRSHFETCQPYLQRKARESEAARPAASAAQASLFDAAASYPD